MWLQNALFHIVLLSSVSCHRLRAAHSKWLSGEIHTDGSWFNESIDLHGNER